MTENSETKISNYGILKRLQLLFLGMTLGLSIGYLEINNPIILLMMIVTSASFIVILELGIRRIIK